MSKPTFLENVREWIGGVAWRVFLWSIRMTEKEYINAIVAESKILDDIP